MIVARLSLALAVLVIVPLGLQLYPPNSHLLYRRVRPVYPVAAVAAVVAIALPRHEVAGLLALPWALFCSGIALGTFFRPGRDLSVATEAVRLVATGFLAFGSWWLVLSRLGMNPMSFGDDIVELTAVHFHYAGFGASVIAAMVKEARPASRFVSACALAVVLGVAGVAIGIASVTAIAALAAALLTAALLSLAAVTIAIVARMDRSSSRPFLLISSLSTVVTMPLALQYAVGRVVDIGTLGISEMAAIHGTINALGFVLCGLLGWRIWRKEKSAATLA